MLLRTGLDRLPDAAEADLVRAARVARRLEPGVLLAVRLRGDPALDELLSRLTGDDLHLLTCSFAPDDHELLIWRDPPGPPTLGRPGRGGTTVDVRRLAQPLPLVAPLAAVAALDPGESVLHVSDAGPPLLLLDVLVGRATMADRRDLGDRVIARLLRHPPREAAPCSETTAPGSAQAPDGARPIGARG